MSAAFLYVANAVYKRFEKVDARVEKVETRVDRVEDQTIENRTNITNMSALLGKIEETVRLNHAEEMHAVNRIYDKMDRQNGH